MFSGNGGVSGAASQCSVIGLPAGAGAVCGSADRASAGSAGTGGGRTRPADVGAGSPVFLSAAGRLLCGSKAAGDSGLGERQYRRPHPPAFPAGISAGAYPGVVFSGSGSKRRIGRWRCEAGGSCGLVLGLPAALMGTILGLLLQLLFHLGALCVLPLFKRQVWSAYPMAPFLAIGYAVAYYV